MVKQKAFSLVAYLAAVGAVVFGVLFTPAMAAGAPSAGGNGLKVSPVVSNLAISAGQTQAMTIYVQNVTQTPVTLQVLVNDFIASGNETGQPALLLDPNEYAPSHSLKRLVAPISNVALAAGERKGVDVSIAIPKGAAAGGYYGAVRFVPANSSGSSSVTLTASVASLVLVRVPGDIKENLQLQSFDIRQGSDGGPNVVFVSNSGLQAVVRIANRGDVQEQPFGKLLLQQNGRQTATYELNNTDPRGNVLPGSTRKFTVDLDKVGVFGKYTLAGNFSYGTTGQLLSSSTTFYVIPLHAILIALGTVLLVLFSIFIFPRLVRNYNRRVIAGARRR